MTFRPKAFKFCRPITAYQDQYSLCYATITVPLGTVPGAHYMLFATGYLNQVSESNETNNVTAVSVTVSPSDVDLVLQQEQQYLGLTAAGNSLRSTVSILNQSTIAATTSTVYF